MAEKKDNLTVAKMDSEARSMKAILDARPKREIKILDRDALESKRKVPPKAVCINGYRYDVPVNKSVSVPDRVAEILEKQGLI